SVLTGECRRGLPSLLAHRLEARPVPPKLAPAPTSPRPARRRAISAPMSKSSCWTRTSTAGAAGAPVAPIDSAPGDRREERDLGAVPQGRRGVGEHPVDRHLDVASLPQRFAPGGAPAAEPGAQLAGAGDAAGQAHFLAREAERLLQGGEVEDRDVHGRTSALRPAANRTAGNARCRPGVSRPPVDCPPVHRPRPWMSAPPSPGSGRGPGRRRHLFARAGTRAGGRVAASRSPPASAGPRVRPAPPPAASAGTAARRAGR